MSTSSTNIVRDIIQWRRKKLSLTILFVATATWVTLEVYQFNFITFASWVTMFMVASTFLWGNILRLLNKPTPDLSELEIIEQSAVDMAHSIRAWVEELVRWMFGVGAEGDWFLFARTVVGLWLLSFVGQLCDLLTLLYIGIVVGMTVPVIYVKYEDKLKECVERLRVQSARFYNKLDEKIFRKIKNKVAGDHQRKEKKID